MKEETQIIISKIIGVVIVVLIIVFTIRYFIIDTSHHIYDTSNGKIELNQQSAMAGEWFYFTVKIDELFEVSTYPQVDTSNIQIEGKIVKIKMPNESIKVNVIPKTKTTKTQKDNTQRNETGNTTNNETSFEKNKKNTQEPAPKNIKVSNSDGKKHIKLNGTEYDLIPNTTDNSFNIDYRGKGIYRVYNKNGQNFGVRGCFYIYNQADFESGLDCYTDICYPITEREIDGEKYYDLSIPLHSYRGVKLYVFECLENGTGYYFGPFRNMTIPVSNVSASEPTITATIVALMDKGDVELKPNLSAEPYVFATYHGKGKLVIEKSSGVFTGESIGIYVVRTDTPSGLQRINLWDSDKGKVSYIQRAKCNGEPSFTININEYDKIESKTKYYIAVSSYTNGHEYGYYLGPLVLEPED